jgi:hypothetical protein
MTTAFGSKPPKSVMAEVDAIIATIEATQNAMATIGFGHMATSYDEGRQMTRWILSTNSFFKDLHNDAVASVGKLDNIIDYIRDTAKEGIKVSAESAKVHIQVLRQDYEFESAAMIETGKEITIHPI